MYFTGKLPADPIGRLFSTVSYAKKIVFSTEEEANKAIDTIRQIHTAVEKNRGDRIPDWAYRDVLFMLIHYSIASWELLERKLSNREKEEVYNVFYRLGTRMGLKALPATYPEWLPERNQHLLDDLEKGNYTADLFKQYEKHLGKTRYKLLIESQKLVVPQRVKELLGFRPSSLFAPAVPLYKFSRKIKMDWLIKKILLPANYQKQIKELDVN